MCLPLSPAHLQSPRWKLLAGEQGRQMRCHTMRCHISLYVAPLPEGTALILSHHSVRMHIRNDHQPPPQSRHQHRELPFLPLSLHPSTKKSINNSTMQSKQNSFLSRVREKMSAHTLNVSKCKYQCSKSIFVVKCTSTLIYCTE